MFGNINANAITTGVLKGDYFELDLSSGFMVMGLRGDDGTFEEEWLKVDNTGMYLNFSSNFADKDELAELEKKVDDNDRELKTNISFSNGIVIGKEESPFKVHITNEELYFSQHGEKIAYISNNKLHITEGHFDNRMSIGNATVTYEWVIRTNNHLSLKVRGDA